MGSTTQWTMRWHVTADGVIIKEWSQGPADSDQIFRRFESTGRAEAVDVDDLVGVDSAVDRFGSFWNRVTGLMLVVGALGGLSLAFGLVLLWVDAAGSLPPILMTVGGTLIVVVVVLSIVAMNRLRNGVPRIYAKVGIADATGATMSGAEARRAIDATGTVSSPPAESVGP